MKIKHFISSIIKSFVMAFSMFSILPMPIIEWKKENLTYMLCALPCVGVFIGIIFCLWQQLCQWLHFGNFLYAIGMTLLPLVLSGGIHMDGFCDTVDALSSHAPVERKREILKDSHAGAFAIIFTVAYFLTYAACCSELHSTIFTACMLGLHQIFARSIGAFAGIQFPSAATGGLLASFKAAANKKAVFLLTCWNLICVVCMILLSPISGITCTITAIICLLYVHRLAQKEFGGMSGDLAGYLITISQLALLICFMITERMVTICFSL